MSFSRRLGRMARGFVGNLQDDDRLRETVRVGRERGETIRDTFGEAFTAAWRGAAEEWRAAEEEYRREEQRERDGGPQGERGGERSSSESQRSAGEQRSGGQQRFSTGGSASGQNASTFAPRKYPPKVVSAYNRLGLMPGASREEVSQKRRELVKRYHPDQFSDPEKRLRAERITAEINAAHDTIGKHFG